MEFQLRKTLHRLQNIRNELYIISHELVELLQASEVLVAIKEKEDSMLKTRKWQDEQGRYVHVPNTPYNSPNMEREVYCELCDVVSIAHAH